MSIEFNEKIPSILKEYYFLHQKGSTYDTYINAHTSQTYRKPSQNRQDGAYYLLEPQTGAQMTKNQKSQVSKRYKLELFLIQNLEEWEYKLYCESLEKLGTLDFSIPKADNSSFLQKLNLGEHLENKLALLLSKYMDVLYDIRYGLKITMVSKLNNYSKLIEVFQNFNYRKKGVQYYIQLKSKQQQQRTANYLKEELQRVSQEELSKSNYTENIDDLFMCLIEPLQAT